MRQATHAMIAAVPDAAVPHELTFPSGLPGFPAVQPAGSYNTRAPIVPTACSHAA